MLLIIFFLFAAGVFFFILDSQHHYLRRLNEKINQGPNAEIWNRSIRILRRVCGLCAAGLFLLVAGVHICSWFPTFIGRYVASLMWLHFLVLAAFFICIGFTQQKRGAGGRKDFLRGVPRWVRVGLNLLFLYMAALFVLQMVHSHHGFRTSERNGKYFMKVEGEPEREIGPEQYWQDESQALCLFSSFWMGFSFCAAAYLLAAKDDVAEADPLNQQVPGNSSEGR